MFNYLKQKKCKKIFCIGSNKTGTTSMRYLFEELKYKVSPQKLQEQTLEDIHFSFNKNLLEKYVARYDFFQDIPFSLSNFYIRLDTLFPESKFILTVREPDSWFNSLYNFHLSIINKNIANQSNKIKVIKKNDLKKIKWIHEDYSVTQMKKNFLTTVNENLILKYDWNLLYSREHYKKIFIKRNHDIINFFQDRPKDLLVIDLSKEKNTKKLYDFLGIKDKPILYPYKNITR